MTTAHRPTWNAAVGGAEQGGSKLFVPTRQYSAKDLPGQQTMKERPPIDIDPKSQDFKSKLLQKEEEYNAKKERRDVRSIGDQKQKDAADEKEEEEEEPVLTKKQKKDADAEVKNLVAADEPRKDSYVNPFPDDEDDEAFINSSKDGSEASDQDNKKDSSDNDNDDDDDDSDNEKLFQEYERVKREREEEQKRKDMEKHEASESLRKDEIMTANPLLDAGGYSLKKKWFEDTVFKNQSKTEPKERKRFINDNVRSDFHKKFLSKYIIN